MLRRPCTRIELKQTDLDEYEEAKAKAKAKARKEAKAKGQRAKGMSGHTYVVEGFAVGDIVQDQGSGGAPGGGTVSKAQDDGQAVSRTDRRLDPIVMLSL